MWHLFYFSNISEFSNRIALLYSRFEVFTAVKMKVEIFWVAALCCVVIGYQRFTGIRCLHLQGEVIGYQSDSKSLFDRRSVGQSVSQS